jgi:hypothetical protein
MRIPGIALTTCLCLVLGTSAIASPRTGARRGVDGRQHRQAVRIHEGIRSGRLTAAEAARLRAGQRSIARLEHRLRRGGLTAWESSVLQRRLDRASREIARQTRDRQRRW